MATETNSDGFEDNILAFDDWQEAHDCYVALIDRADLHSASVVAPIESTDYDESQWLVIYTICT